MERISTAGGVCLWVHRVSQSVEWRLALGMCDRGGHPPLQTLDFDVTCMSAQIPEASRQLPKEGPTVTV